MSKLAFVNYDIPQLLVSVVGMCRRYWLCNRRLGCERHAKKVGNFDFLCWKLKEVKEKLLGFVLVYKLACTALCYCAFHKHANSKVQKPLSQLRISLPSIIITITSNEP